MSKKSLRVHVIVHEDGRRTATLLPTWSSIQDRPPPAAYGATMEELWAELEAKLEVLELEAKGSIDRFLWGSDFETHRVRVQIHPLSSIRKQPVIGKQEIPLLLTYASCPLEGGGYRLVLPRFGAWFIVEELSLAADVLRHAVSTMLLGENPRWLYDFREASDEYVTEWSPALLSRTRAEARPSKDDDARPELTRVADDLVLRAAQGKLPPVVGDSALFESIKGMTSGPSPLSLLFVGPPGVGKTALVRRLAAHHVAIRKESADGAARIFSTSRDRIVAGMVYLGMWQARCLTLAKELSAEGDYLHVDSLVGLLDPQPDGATIADFFEPEMDELHILAECTEEQLERARRQRPSLVKRFSIVRVDEPTAPELLSLALAYARKKSLDVHPSAMKRLVRHLGALERGVAFPGKALRFLDWLGTLELERRGTLYPQGVSEAYSRYSGVPIGLLSDDIALGAPALAALLKARVIGQDDACEACGKVLARFKANLTDPDRPSATLLFVGPTGVGKTELAKQLARTTFGGEDRMVRLDMSEYMLPGSAARLLDARPGTLGLAARVRERPLSLVLFDEIEKAHPEVFDLLLGILGEGRMTDASGRFVDFRGTLIVMTSNLGVTDARPVGFGEATGGDFVRKVRAHFRPELAARIDAILTFRALLPSDVARIVDIELAASAKREGLVRRNLRLSVTPQAKARLAELGYHPTRGARPLRRLIEERVVAPIATALAADPTFQGGTILVAGGDESASANLVIRLD